MAQGFFCPCRSKSRSRSPEIERGSGLQEDPVTVKQTYFSISFRLLTFFSTSQKSKVAK